MHWDRREGSCWITSEGEAREGEGRWITGCDSTAVALVDVTLRDKGAFNEWRGALFGICRLGPGQYQSTFVF